MLSLIKKIVGTKNDREIKRIRPYVGQINQIEAEFQRLSDAELKAKTQQFRNRLAEATASLQKELEEARNEAVGADQEQRDEHKTRVDELDKELRDIEAGVLRSCCQRLLPPCARLRVEPSACAISTCN